MGKGRIIEEGGKGEGGEKNVAKDEHDQLIRAGRGGRGK